ncbi:hypothetical protein B0J18DRAFT_43084 [Chaetomium sp. MPI-SDFR-AT-0129]|nr:hypothetical protein B0J18DRAFT_43084 [Chaetomium sp. MPI-SDFR-AT-0129]
MANDSPRDIPWVSSPDPTASEGNSSVQVNFDSLSQRGRSVDRRSPSSSIRPSPSRGGPEHSLARQATANSLTTFLASQPSSQPSQGDQPPPSPEDVLRDLIDIPESTGDVIRSFLHGVKRPHNDDDDDDMADEPQPKRDKLGEELESMSGPNYSLSSIVVSSGSSPFSFLAASTPTVPTRTVPTSDAGPSTPPTRTTLPLRPPRRRPLHLTNRTDVLQDGVSMGFGPSHSGHDEAEDEDDQEGGEPSR